MLRIADNIGDYYAYQLKISRDKKVEKVGLNRLEVKFGSDTNNQSFNNHNNKPNNFKEVFDTEIKKYR
jgi:hypothetical protein